MISTEKILKEKGLRVTPIRIKILELFGSTQIALSQSDLESELDESDRITLYRTLKRFESTGILHKVINDSNQKKFALCSDSCGYGDHVDEHVHFQCEKCGNTQCLEDVPIPQITVPDGFKMNSSKILMTGICNQCQ